MTTQMIDLNEILYFALCKYLKFSNNDDVRKINDTLFTFCELNSFDIYLKSSYILLYLYNKNKNIFNIQNQGYLESLFYLQIVNLLNERKNDIEKNLVNIINTIDSTSNCFSPI